MIFILRNFSLNKYHSFKLDETQEKLMKLNEEAKTKFVGNNYLPFLLMYPRNVCYSFFKLLGIG